MCIRSSLAAQVLTPLSPSYRRKLTNGVSGFV